MSQLPKLKAEESLRRVDEAAIASGMMKKADQNAILRGWRKEAGIRETTQPRTKKHAAIVHEGMGIGLTWRTSKN